MTRFAGAGSFSRPFDGEGMRRRRAMIDGGMLTTWLLDLASARQLGFARTGHGSQRLDQQPLAGDRHALSRGADGRHQSGLYITELMGIGVNGVTGDYSRGASGFWIENGRKAWPVSGLTVASNLKDMFLNMTPSSDLQFKSATNAPTVRMEGMTIAGS